MGEWLILCTSKISIRVSTFEFYRDQWRKVGGDDSRGYCWDQREVSIFSLDVRLAIVGSGPGLLWLPARGSLCADRADRHQTGIHRLGKGRTT